MNSNLRHYLLSEAWLGVRRNRGASIATVLFLMLSMCFMSFFFIARILMTDVTDYLQTQLSMKVYIEQGVDSEKVADILRDKDFIKEADVEPGEEILAQLAFFFAKRDYLLDAFSDGKVNDAILLTLTDSSQMDDVAAALATMNGIEKVVYPQQLAQMLQQTLSTITLYGVIVTVVLMLITFLMIYMTTHLALYRREQELKVKLLVGMNPQHVRLQFFIEAMILAVISAIISIIIVSLLARNGLDALATLVPFLTAVSTTQLVLCMGVALLICFLFTIGASYLATRKWIRHA